MNLFIGNINQETTETQLHAALSSISPHSFQLTLPITRHGGKRRPFAFAKYSNHEMAMAALTIFNSAQVTLHNHVLKFSPSKNNTSITHRSNINPETSKKIGTRVPCPNCNTLIKFTRLRQHKLVCPNRYKSEAFNSFY